MRRFLCRQWKQTLRTNEKSYKFIQSERRPKTMGLFENLWKCSLSRRVVEGPSTPLIISANMSALTYAKCAPTPHKAQTLLKALIGPRCYAQTVSRWLPIAATRIRTRVWPCGICGGWSGAGVGFLRVLRFHLTIFIQPVAPQSPYLTSGAGKIGQKSHRTKNNTEIGHWYF
jgi:ribosomal protein L37AE/L43A